MSKKELQISVKGTSLLRIDSSSLVGGEMRSVIGRREGLNTSTLIK